jgi:putative ABC transport system permease protein
MSICRLVWKELSYRRTNFALSLLGVWATVALFVAFRITSDAARRETIRVTRDLGFNLRIIARETDMDRFWALGYSDQTLPEDAVRRLADYPRVFVAFNHLVATLQRRFPLGEREVLLTGLAPAITAPEQRRRPMGYAPKPGTLIAGFRVAQRLGLKPQTPLTLGGQDFVVERCLAESGTEEDIRLYTSLADAQRVLGLPGRLSEIQAIDCLCLTVDQDPLRLLRAELEQALPEATVVQLRTLADARARQRQTAERYFAKASPFLLLICAGWVALLAALNARERRLELGVLHALGHSPGRLATLFLVRALSLGVVAAALGWATGTLLALRVGPDIFRVTANAITADFAVLGYALIAAPLFTCLATAIPALHAVTLDPAVILREG